MGESRPAEDVNLFDESMETYGGKEYVFNVNPLPQCGTKVVVTSAGQIVDPISFGDFIRHACRCPTGVKTASILFDYHQTLPEFGRLSAVGDAVQSNDLSRLPAGLQLGATLPEGAIVGFVVRNNEDGTCEALKVIWFAEPINT